MFSTAIVRRPGPDFARGLTTASLGTPDFEVMAGQHAAYVSALKRLGLEVVELPPLDGFPDAYFVEDAALVFPEVAVATRPGAESRRGEVETLVPVLSAFRPVERLTAPGTLDGGDVLVVGRRVFVGLSGRTNEAGAGQLADVLAPHGYTVEPVPVGRGLHLKSSVNHLGSETVLLAPFLEGTPAFAGFRRIVVPAEEAYAANVLWVNGTVFVPAGYPVTLERVSALGLPVVVLEVMEAGKMDGGLTCMSLRF